METQKILCLGNEFIKEDSFAKKIGEMLSIDGYVIKNINDSFQLMESINEGTDFIILDVVLGLKEVKMLEIFDLKLDPIVSCHDFDSGYILKLLGEGKDFKIIGIPESGNVDKIKKSVKEIISVK